jgi:hypothetical protein
MSEPQAANESLLNAGVAALRAGQAEQARSLLGQVVRSDPGNERAWLFLAGALSDDTQRRYCLERVLSINPQNAPARRGLSALAAAAQPSPAPQPAPVPPPAPVQVAPVQPVTPPVVQTAAPPVVQTAAPPVVQPSLAAPVAPPAMPVAPPAASPPPTPAPASAAFSLPMLSARFEPAAIVEPTIAAPPQQAVAAAVTTPAPAPPAAPQTLLIRPSRPANRLVWGVVLALGLMLMLSSTIYAALLLRG